MSALPPSLPSVNQFDESTSSFFGTVRGGPQWNEFDEDDELPMGRNTLKARSKEIVISKGQSPSKGGNGVSGLAYCHQENFSMQPPPARAYNPRPGGAGYPSFPSAPPPPAAGGLKPHAPSAGSGGWQISDDMMKQPWGSVLRQLNNQPRR